MWLADHMAEAVLRFFQSLHALSHIGCTNFHLHLLHMRPSGQDSQRPNNNHKTEKKV